MSAALHQGKRIPWLLPSEQLPREQGTHPAKASGPLWKAHFSWKMVLSPDSFYNTLFCFRDYTHLLSYSIRMRKKCEGEPKVRSKREPTRHHRRPQIPTEGRMRRGTCTQPACSQGTGLLPPQVGHFLDDGRQAPTNHARAKTGSGRGEAQWLADRGSSEANSRRRLALVSTGKERIKPFASGCLRGAFGQLQRIQVSPC